MIYALTIIRHIKNGPDILNQDYFAKYSNAYAFQSRRMRDLLEANPGWRHAEDREKRDFNHGTYSRTVRLVDCTTGRTAATLYLKGVHFEDGLVEEDPDLYEEDDYPETTDNK